MKTTSIKLTADQLKAAKAAGMTAEEYVNYMSPQPDLPAPKRKKRSATADDLIAARAAGLSVADYMASQE